MTVIHYISPASDKRIAPLISVVIPFYNEESVIQVCHDRVVAALDNLRAHCEIIYIDDGSNDDSAKMVSELSSELHDISLIRLSRNFGKEAAMSAGIKATRGEAVVLLDADLQDPPELISDMVEQWQQGYDVVDMQRRERLGESAFKRYTAAIFYKVLNRLCDVPIPENVGDFRLLDRRVVDTINDLPERTRFMKGLFAWPGFRRTVLQFDRDPRLAGQTKWNTSKLVNLAVEGITSFSTKPLRLATFAGVATALGAGAMAAVVFLKTLIWGDPVAGYPSMILVVLILGSIQLLSIGLMGEYIGRLFIESKQRPLYLVDTHFTAPATHSSKAVTEKTQ